MLGKVLVDGQSLGIDSLTSQTVGVLVPALSNMFSMRIIESVEKAIKGKNCTFTAFVVEAVRVALENLEDEK